MRIRQVKPEFFKDGRIAELTPVARLAYIGLWMLADDGGWFRLDVPAIALELFGYEPRAERETTVAEILEALILAERIEVHDCGHARVPTLVDHQRFGGETKRVYTIRREHEKCPRGPAGVAGEPLSGPIPAGARGSPLVPDPVRNGTERSGTVRQGSVNARKRDDETESEFRLRVGKPSFMGGDA